MRDLVSSLLTEAGATTKVFWQYKLMGDSLKSFVKLRDQVKEFFGDDLEPDGIDPHVTLLYMGKVPKSDVPKILEAGKMALSQETTDAPFSVYASGGGVGFFPISDSSEGRQPIVLDITGPVDQINALLLRACASWVSKNQFPVYKAHACLGYLTRNLTADEYMYLRRFGKTAYDVSFRMDEVLMTAPGLGEWRVQVGPTG